MQNALILIPSRMASTRLPDKPLADIHGVPMIVHVWRRAMEANIGRVVVATDHDVARGQPPPPQIGEPPPRAEARVGGEQLAVVGDELAQQRARRRRDVDEHRVTGEAGRAHAAVRS